MNFLDFEIKSADRGEFTAVASAPSLDRDGEVLSPGCFKPLPRSLPVLVNHKRDQDPVGKAVPRYVGNELHVHGTFAGTARAQEVRELVTSGGLGFVSVGFMSAKYAPNVRPPTIVSGDLFEISLVSVPSNRDARVLSARSFSGDGDVIAMARKVWTETILQLAQDDLDAVHNADYGDARKLLADIELDELARTDPRAFARAVLRDLGRL